MCSLSGQSWNRTYDYDQGHDGLGSVLPLSNGGYFSFSRIITQSYFGYWAFEVDAYGDTVWTSSILDYEHLYSASGSGSIIKTSDGNYLVGATVYDDSLDFLALAIKYNTAGDTIWKRSFGTSGFDVTNQVSELYPNQYLIAGTRADPTQDFGLYLIDQDGTLIWDRSYPHTGQVNHMSGFGTMDGGIVMSGSRTINVNDKSLYVLKTDSTGNVLWTKDLGSPWIDNVAFINEYPNGNLMVSGAVRTNPNNTQKAGYLAELDPNGNTIWTETYQGVSLIFFTRAVITNTGVVVAGNDFEGFLIVGILLKAGVFGFIFDIN